MTNRSWIQAPAGYFLTLHLDLSVDAVKPPGNVACDSVLQRLILY